MLAGTPGRPPEASGGTANSPDHQQAGKTGRAPPEHGRPAQDAGTAIGAKGQDDALARQPATGPTRQDHAAAMLAGRPGRPPEAPGDSRRAHAASGDDNASDGATAHAGGKSMTAGDSGPGQHTHIVPAERHQAHDGRQHDRQQAASPQDSRQSPAQQDQGGTWPPPRADQDHARALYQQDFGEQPAAPSASTGRDRGTNVIGDKPVKSPGDTSDLPPTGEELLKMQDDKKPRLEKLRDKFYEELEDVDDATKEQGETLQNLLERPPPTGHPEVAVNAGPMIGPEIAQHVTVDAGSVAEVALVLGVIGYQTGRWMEHRVEKLLGR
jgi:hypothetical protein